MVLLKSIAVKAKLRCVVLAMAFSVALTSGCGSHTNSSQKLAPEGHGLLPRPTGQARQLAGSSSTIAFVQELSEGQAELYSRRLFESETNAEFKITVREYSVPPRNGPNTISQGEPAVLELRTDGGTLNVGGRQREWKQGTMEMIAAGVPVQVSNPTDREMILRFYVLEVQ